MDGMGPEGRARAEDGLGVGKRAEFAEEGL